MPREDSPRERAEIEDPGESESDSFSPPDSGGITDAVTQLLDEVTAETQPQPLFDATNLRGQVAIITGGSSGIGRAVALEMAQCGAHVAFCFRDDGAQSRLDAQAVARELRQQEVRSYFRSCDVRDSKEVNKVVAEVMEELDAMIVNACRTAGLDAGHFQENAECESPATATAVGRG